MTSVIVPESTFVSRFPTSLEVSDAAALSTLPDFVDMIFPIK